MKTGVSISGLSRVHVPILFSLIRARRFPHLPPIGRGVEVGRKVTYLHKALKDTKAQRLISPPKMRMKVIGHPSKPFVRSWGAWSVSFLRFCGEIGAEGAEKVDEKDL